MHHARYKRLSSHLNGIFGGPVRKVTFKAGMNCPNRDGKKGTGGCTFCSGRELIPSYYLPGEGIAAQIRRGIASAGRQGSKPIKGFIAYLQDHTGTNCEPERLKEILDEAAGVEGVIGLSIGTRPDCLGDGVLEVIGEAAGRLPLWLEIGLQTSSDRTLAAINRNHTAGDFAAAVEAAKVRGIRTVAHAVLGLPGEGIPEILATADFLAQTGIEGIKLHNILVLRGTSLAGIFESGLYRPPTLRQYADWAVRFLERTPPEVVIHRLAAEAPAELITAPNWAMDKHVVISAVETELESRNTRQGRHCGGRAESGGRNSTEVSFEAVHQA